MKEHTTNKEFLHGLSVRSLRHPAALFTWRRQRILPAQ